MRLKHLFNVIKAKISKSNSIQSYNTAMQTHIGSRIENEDSLKLIPHTHGLLAVVCDGLGGHEGGELASRYFTEACEEYLITHANKSDFEDGTKLLGLMIEYCVTDLIKKFSQHKNLRKAQTTCVIAWINEHAINIAHVGDSRAYVFDQNQQIIRTRDHSVVQMLVDQDEIKEQEMGTHPDQGRLLKTISLNQTAKPTIKKYPPLQAEQTLILCSDGFWEMITPSEMMAFNKKTNIKKYLNKLVLLANKRAGKKGDNVTAIIVQKGVVI